MIHRENSVSGKNFRPFSWLIATYLFFFLLRYALALFTSTQPTIVIDEMLYYSIAKSIATKGELLYHAQSADYSYFLYPLILSPIYLLPQGVPYYRLIQLLNCLMMNAAIFPAYALAKEITGNEKKALLLSGLTALLPDFLLGQIVASESLLYPLYYSLFLLIYRFLKTDRPKYLPACGILGGIMYSVKPGAVAPACLILIAAVILNIRKRSYKSLLMNALSILVMVAVCFLNYLISVKVFGSRSSLLSVYSEKLETGYDFTVLTFLLGTLRYLFYFMIGGGLPALLCILYMRGSMRSADRRMAHFLAFCVLTVCAVTVLTVDRTEDYSVTNARYFAMYLPPILMLCCTRKERDGAKSLSAPVLSALLCGFTAVYAAVFGCQPTEAGAYYGCSLDNFFFTVSRNAAWDIIIRISLAVLSLLAIIPVLKKSKALRFIALYGSVFLFLVNSVFAYRDASRTYDPPVAGSAEEIVNCIGDRSYSLITTDTGLSYVYPIEANTKYSPDYLYLQDLIQKTDPEKGRFVCYTPFLLRGVIPDRPISYPDILVLDPSAYACATFSSACRTLFDSNDFKVVEIPKEGRWADSMIHGVYRCELAAGTKGVLCVWNDALLSSPMTVCFCIDSDQETTLSINNTNELLTLDIHPGKALYEFTFSHPEDSYNFSIDRGTVRIRGYEITNPD